jgi:hypothetical protein
MQAIERQVLDRFKDLLKQRLPQHQIIMFGSRARGDAEPYSDLDVMVIIDGLVDEVAREWVSDCAWEAGYAQGLIIVPVVVSRTQWEQGPLRHSLLAQAVALAGIPLQEGQMNNRREKIQEESNRGPGDAAEEVFTRLKRKDPAED